MRRPEPHPTDTVGRQLVRVLAIIVFAIGAVFGGGTAAAILYLERNPPPLSAFMWISRTSDPSTDLPCDEVLYEWVDRDRISPHLRLAVVLAAVNRVVARSARLKHMNWLPLQLARPFWAMGRCLLEMRYLWTTAHRLDGTLIETLLPDFHQTPLDVAIASALPSELIERDVQPNQVVATGRNPGLT